MREGSPARPQINLRAEETCPGVPYFHHLLSHPAFGPPSQLQAPQQEERC